MENFLYVHFLSAKLDLICFFLSQCAMLILNGIKAHGKIHCRNAAA